MKNYRESEKNEYSKQPFQPQFLKRQIDGDDCWTLFTNQIMINYKFLFPYQKIFQFIERYEKYRLRAALSSIPISLQTFESIYKQVLDKSYENQKKYITKAITIISDLLNIINVAKLQEIRTTASIIEGFRLACLQKDLDPYEFKINQFDQDFKKVTKYLGRAELLIEKSQIQMIKSQVAQMTQKLKSKQKQVMDSMNSCKVKHPYLAQNKCLQIINCQKLFQSYIRSVKIKNRSLDDTLYRKYCSIHKTINEFGYYCKEFNLNCQKNANNIVDNYNNSLLNQTNKNGQGLNRNEICRPVIQTKTKKYVDANDINMSWMSRTQARSCLINKHEQIQISQTVHFFDIQKNQDMLLQMNVKQNLFKENNQNQNQIYIDKECNPFNSQAEKKGRRFLQLTNQRLRPQIKNQSIQKNTHLSQKLQPLKKTIKLTKYQVKFQANQSSKIFKSLIEDIKKQQRSIWIPTKQKDETKLSTTLYFVNKNQKYKHEINNQIQQQNEQIYQSKKSQQQKRRLLNMKKILIERTYAKFAQLNINPKTKKPMFSSQYRKNQNKIEKYGISLNIDLKQNSIQQLNKFFVYYFKERYYRENQKVKQNKDIPIFLSQQNREDFLSDIVIKRIVSLVSKYGFFILWGNDLIIYQQKKKFQDVFANFYLVPYKSELQCQKAMFQIRKKLIKSNKQIQEIIQTKFLQSKLQTKQQKCDHLNELFSKIQVVKRILYDSHYAPLNRMASAKKGRQIAQKIIEELSQNDN